VSRRETAEERWAQLKADWAAVGADLKAGIKWDEERLEESAKRRDQEAAYRTALLIPEVQKVFAAVWPAAAAKLDGNAHDRRLNGGALVPAAYYTYYKPARRIAYDLLHKELAKVEDVRPVPSWVPLVAKLHEELKNQLDNPGELNQDDKEQIRRLKCAIDDFLTYCATSWDLSIVFVAYDDHRTWLTLKLADEVKAVWAQAGIKVVLGQNSKGALATAVSKLLALARVHMSPGKVSDILRVRQDRRR
jgi:hypothetical protein